MASFFADMWQDIKNLFRGDSGLTPEAVVSTGAPLHEDGWINWQTGVGTWARDKTQHTYFDRLIWRLDDPQLLAMFNGSDLARKAVRLPWKEMFRRGYEAKAEDVDPDEIADLKKYMKKLRVDYHVRRAGTFGGLFGGGVLIMGADDGQTPDKPLDMTRIKTVRYLNWIDRRYVTVYQYYSDPLAPNFGQPEIYRIISISNGTGVEAQAGAPSSAMVHESRVIRFEGAETDDVTRRQLAGWSYSVLQAPFDTLRRFEHAFEASTHLLSDASQAVFKLQGLINMIASGQKNAVLARMQMVDMSRSTARAVVIDAESEEFKREGTQFAGISDLLDRMMMRISAAFGIPVTKLFGKSAAGLNATGDNDVRDWYDELASRQTDEVAPILERIFAVCAAAADSPVEKKDAEFEFTFAPLWQATDLEVAQVRFTVAQGDNIYLTQGVLTPEQVALARWGSGKFSPEVQVDADALQKSIDAAKAFDPYENDPNKSQDAVANQMAQPNNMKPDPKADPGKDPVVEGQSDAPERK